MAIEETFVPGVPHPTYRVAGDPKWYRRFTTREAAEKREAELAGKDTDTAPDGGDGDGDGARRR